MLIFQVLLFVLGIVIGSFLAALTYRFVRGISNLKGRSFCDNCGKQIFWFDNIPLLSYIALGGKCRFCGKKISPRYFIIELATGVGFVLIGPNLLPLIIFCVLEAILIIDFENQIIPDAFTFSGIAVVFIYLLLLSPGSEIFTSILSGFVSATFLLAINMITNGRGMGLGDVKFAVLGGMLVGLTLSPIWFLVAFLTGAICGIILIVSHKAKLKSKIAFGPFLVLSIPITLLWGQKILDMILLR